MLGLLDARPHRRRPSLTPMIDVVFLLLVFFMLAARFGLPAAQPVALAAPGGERPYSGPPRLVDITPEQLRLNGTEVPDLPAALAPLMQSPADTILLRPAPGVTVQRLLDISGQLRAEGFTGIAIIP